MKKRKYVISCMAKEFHFLWMYYVIVAFLVFGFIIYFSFETNGTALGLANITNAEQLEKFFAHSDNQGRIHPDSVFATGLQVDLTERNEKNLSFQVGGAYVETPSVTLSTYDRTYDIYAATLEDSVVIVLAGFVFNQSQADLRHCDVIELHNENIGGWQNLVDGLTQAYPDFFGQFRNIYVAKGGHPENYSKSYTIILMIFVLAAVLLYAFPYLYPIQRITYMGKQIARFAKAEGRTFKEMCERLNEYGDRALYKNGLEMLSSRYVVIREPKRLVSQTQEQMKIYALDGTYGVPYVENITIMNSRYPDEMNDINITTGERKHYYMTVHKTRQEVEELLAQMGFREMT